MTTTLDNDVIAPDVPPSLRRVWRRVLVVLAVLVVLGAGIGWFVFIVTYQPLSLTSGPYGTVTPQTLRTISDGLNDTNTIVVGPTGTKATAIYPIINNGSRPVRLLGLDQPDQAVVRQALTWAPLSGTGAGPTGLPGSARALPVTIQPGAEVLILETVTQPNCAISFGSGGSETLTDVLVRWSALGVHHVWDLPLQGNPSTLPISVCPTTAALRHISAS